MNTEVTDLRSVLDAAKTIVIIGCSPNPYRTSNYIAKFLMDKGYKVIPVNPGQNEILGEKCYDKLTDIPADTKVDIINIFRNPAYTQEVMNDIVKWKLRSGQNPVVWTQLGVSTPQAEATAQEQHIPYVKNKCIMVEWEKAF